MIKNLLKIAPGCSTVMPNASHCINMYHKKADCTDCKDVCSFDAINIGRPGTGVAINPDRCTSCEQCVSACNNGVFNRTGVNEINWCESILSKQSEGKLSLVCSNNSMKKIGNVTCLGSIHALYLLYWITGGVKEISAYSERCKTCAIGDGKSYLLKQIETLIDFSKNIRQCNIIAESEANNITIKVKKFGLIKKQTAEKQLTRRDFFKSFGRDWAAGIANTLDVVSNESASSIKFDVNSRISQRKTLSDSLLKKLKSQLNSKLKYIPDIPIASVEINEKCMSCGLCAKLCPTGSITKTPEGFIEHITSTCTGCGVCAKACMGGNISFSEIINLKKISNK